MTELRPFTTDGCSGSVMCLLRLGWRVLFWLRLMMHPAPPWEAVCVEHDRKYHPGGTVADRLAADLELASAISALGYPRLARLMFIGVSIGGVWFLPLPWRWGYGYPWPRPYDRAADPS